MAKEINPEAVKLQARLESAAEYLDMCSRLGKDVAWDYPIIERRYTVMDVLRQAKNFIDTGRLLE